LWRARSLGLYGKQEHHRRTAVTGPFHTGVAQDWAQSRTAGNPHGQLMERIGGPWLTILELFRRVKSSQGFRTLESPRGSDSDEETYRPIDAKQNLPYLICVAENALGTEFQNRLPKAIAVVTRPHFL